MKKKPESKSPVWNDNDLFFALECAADFLEAEEWPEDDGGAQVAANQEAAKRVRRMANRLGRKQHAGKLKNVL